MSVRLKYPNGIAVCVCVCLECNSLHRFWLNVIDNLLCLFMQRCVVLSCWFPSVAKVGIGITGHFCACGLCYVVVNAAGAETGVITSVNCSGLSDRFNLLIIVVTCWLCRDVVITCH